MYKNYQTDGRQAALDDLVLWLDDMFPRKPLEERPIQFICKRDRAKAMTLKAKKFKVRCRASMKWRDEVSDRLKINLDDVTRASNTIIDMMEKALINGKKVRIKNFGDFVFIETQRGQSLRFRPLESWQRDLNLPIFNSDIGLKHKVVKGRLKRRLPDKEDINNDLA